MLIPSRNDSRKSSERRKQDRRQVDFEFGTEQWIDYVKINYMAWPKADRRLQSRRAGERRQQTASESRMDYKSSRLTEEEEIFFDNLFKDQD